MEFALPGRGHALSLKTVCQRLGVDGKPACIDVARRAITEGYLVRVDGKLTRVVLKSFRHNRRVVVYELDLADYVMKCSGGAKVVASGTTEGEHAKRKIEFAIGGIVSGLVQPDFGRYPEFLAGRGAGRRGVVQDETDFQVDSRPEMAGVDAGDGRSPSERPDRDSADFR
jgi:hypothetical protein